LLNPSVTLANFVRGIHPGRIGSLSGEFAAFLPELLPWGGPEQLAAEPL